MEAESTKFNVMEIQEGNDGECILVLENDNLKDVQYFDLCNEDDKEIINITNGETCRGCQTESFGFVDVSFLINIPVLFCSQPSPGVAATQCNIPFIINKSVGTDTNDACSEDSWKNDDNHNNNKDCEHETATRVRKCGRPRRSSRGGSSSKYRKISTEPKEYFSKDVIIPENSSRRMKVSDGRRRIKKVDNDFEYDLGGSEEASEIKLEVDDYNDKDWRIGSDEDDSGEVNTREMELVDIKVEEKSQREGDENLDMLWKGKDEQLDSVFNEAKETSDIPKDKKKNDLQDLDYKSLIDAVVWKPDLEGNQEDELYCDDENSFLNEKQIQTIGLNDLIPVKEQDLPDQVKKYTQTARVKYHKEKVIKNNGKKVFKCLKCHKEFDKRMHLTEHRKVHSRKSRDYNCSECGKVFNEARKYFQHLAYHEHIFQCATCKRNFTLLANLKKHITIHENGPSKVCDICGSQFATDKELKIHHETEHTDDNVHSYFAKCEHCAREYKRQESYIEHKSKAPYKCPTCSLLFGCEFEQKRHIRYDHDQFVCEFCGKSFKTNSILNHIKVMHKEAQIKCPHCPKKFVYRSRMLSHVDSSHNDEKKYKCYQCSYSAKTANSLNLHRRKCHLDPKKFRWYECDICSRKFYLPSKLALHYRGHTGEKPFACQTCGKTFASKYNMTEHERAVHGERIEVKNPDGTSVVRHIKHRRAPRASGRRCDLCGIDFPSSTAIIEHMKKSHAPQSVAETTNIKVDIKFEPPEETREKCLEYEVLGNPSDVILSDSSSMVNIRAEEIPENATLVEIDGVEYQVIRQ